MSKPVYVICEQQRLRSACVSAQSDQRLCCSLLRLYDDKNQKLDPLRALKTFIRRKVGHTT